MIPCLAFSTRILEVVSERYRNSGIPGLSNFSLILSFSNNLFYLEYYKMTTAATTATTTSAAAAAEKMGGETTVEVQVEVKKNTSVLMFLSPEVASYFIGERVSIAILDAGLHGFLWV